MMKYLPQIVQTITAFGCFLFSVWISFRGGQRQCEGIETFLSFGALVVALLITTGALLINHASYQYSVKKGYLTTPHNAEKQPQQKSYT